MFNKNVYWNGNNHENDYFLKGIANKWSWRAFINFKHSEKTKDDYINRDLTEDHTKLLSQLIYSIGEMPTKEYKTINSFQGGIRMTHPGRAFYTGDLTFEFYEDQNFSVTSIFHRLLDTRFANITILDEDYPYKDSNEEIDNIEIRFYDSSKTDDSYMNITFYECWVKEFEYINNLETKNEEENLKCRAVIKYNYYG